MKKSKIFIGIFFILTIIVLLSFLKSKIYATRALNEIDNNRKDYYYSDLFTYYLFENYDLPQTMTEAIKYSKELPIYYNFDRWMIDPFSINNKLLQYYIIKDSAMITKGYVLLSRGFDKRFNNHFIGDSTLLESSINKLKIYNPLVAGYDIVLEESKNHMLGSYFFGKKDYLVFYFDIKKDYASQIDTFYSIDNFWKRINEFNYNERNDKIHKQVYGVTFNQKNISVYNKKHIQVKDSMNNTFLFEIKNFKTNDQFRNDEVITVAGILANIDKNSFTIWMKNCFLYTE